MSAVMQANMGTPSCSAFDAENGILCLAGRGAGAEGVPYVSLWQMGSGVRPNLVARYGRPARQPWMRAAKREGQPWCACIHSGSRTALIAAPGQPLHIFTWQVGDLDYPDFACIG